MHCSETLFSFLFFGAICLIDMEIVFDSDAPELVGLLAELRESLDILHKKVEPLLEKVDFNMLVVVFVCILS